MKTKTKSRYDINRHRCDMNRPRPRHGPSPLKCKKCRSMIMSIGIKQHLSNI